LTNPDPPSSLQNNAAVTSTSVIGLTWAAPAINGGTPVIDYRVSWDQGTSAFVELASGITATAYTTNAPLTAGTRYKFKVESRNAYGFSSFSNEVSILAAKVPTKPLDLANDEARTGPGTITITWSPP